MRTIQPRQSLDLIDDLAIVQGGSWAGLAFVVPGDRRTATPKGEIKTAIKDEGGQLLAEFAFGAGAYDALTDTTSFIPTLTPAQTSALPITRYQGKGKVATARNCFVYDLELREDDQPTIKTLASFVQVVGEVTE
jgi:hypothetical protein